MINFKNETYSKLSNTDEEDFINKQFLKNKKKKTQEIKSNIIYEDCMKKMTSFKCFIIIILAICIYFFVLHYFLLEKLNKNKIQKSEDNYNITNNTLYKKTNNIINNLTNNIINNIKNIITNNNNQTNQTNFTKNIQ